MSPKKYIVLILVALLAACQSIPAPVTFETPWRAIDLRILEAPNLPDAAFDLVGAYARLTKTDLELRFDFLGSPSPFDYDFFVAIDTGQGEGGRLPFNAETSFNWDIALGFPARGLPRVFNAAGAALNIRPRIHRDSILDADIVRISRLDLAGDPLLYNVFAYVVRSGENKVADSIGPMQVGGAAPIFQAPLSISFWDTFPSATPAQALRRWSGAHAGPYGQRHGLSVLLQAALQNGIPVAALDLKRVEQLSALEAVGGITLTRKMQEDNLLLLPDQSFGDPQAASASLEFSISAGQRFKLIANPFRFGAEILSPPGEPQSGKTVYAAFTRLADSSHLLSWNKIRLVPLPALEDVENAQADQEGLTIASRSALLQAALSPDPADLVVLGGDLPNSPWGDSLIAAPAFRYIAGHPWIHALDGNDLLQFPTIDGTPTCPDLLCIPKQEFSHSHQAQILQALREAPEGLFRDLAWQTYLRLTEPTSDVRLQALRAGYLGQVGPLLAAARWNASPADQSTCDNDWNWDGAAECILSSENMFLALDPIGGRLVLAATRFGNEPFEWIGPRSQFVVGLGDPFEWLPERGLAGDPQEISGAFADPINSADTAQPWEPYQSETRPGVIIMTNRQDGSRKTFRLAGRGIQVSIEGQQQPTQIPLALIGKRTYEPGGFALYQSAAGQSTRTVQENLWNLGHEITVRSSVKGAVVTVESFSDSRSLLNQEEDPNIGYPPGHFVPFPLSIIHLQPQGDFTVNLMLDKP